MFKSAKSSKARKRLQRQQQLQQQQQQQPVFKQDYFNNCHKTYSCIHCRAHLANHDELISKLFQGNHGRAYLFNKVVNIGCKQAVQRELLTGLHAVADIYCDSCETTLGWKYEQAFVASQKYKEGKYIIELVHMLKENDWDLTSYNARELLQEASKPPARPLAPAPASNRNRNRIEAAIHNHHCPPQTRFTNNAIGYNAIELNIIGQEACMFSLRQQSRSASDANNRQYAPPQSSNLRIVEVAPNLQSLQQQQQQQINPPQSSQIDDPIEAGPQNDNKLPVVGGGGGILLNQVRDSLEKLQLRDSGSERAPSDSQQQAEVEVKVVAEAEVSNYEQQSAYQQQQQVLSSSTKDAHNDLSISPIGSLCLTSSSSSSQSQLDLSNSSSNANVDIDLDDDVTATTTTTDTSHSSGSVINDSQKKDDINQPQAANNKTTLQLVATDTQAKVVENKCNKAANQLSLPNSDCKAKHNTDKKLSQ